jgi:Zn-finger nucleic acid-binding protein
MLKGIGMRRPEINKLLNEARSREIERYERNANKHKARTSAVATQWHQRILVSVQATRRLEL